MARGGNQQREIAELLADPGASLCELGCGPGVLATLLAQRHTRLRLHLVDPSPVMRSQAAHRCRRWLHGGRVSVCAGTAEHIPLPDAACDTVVAVNNVAMWTDLRAGLREIHRILRPGGRLLVTWHSATAPSSTQRRLALSDDGTRIVGEALKTTFGNVHHHRLAHSLVWTARRHE
jgi:ubiquinone/menaquinone biosynthesis C-methylase UbiE